MKEKPVVGIATDGAHSAKERLTRFRAVDLSSGKELFSKAIGNWTNNIGEFLGIVEAVRYVMEARIKDIEVLHWDNRLWGEIPADFGNK